MKPRITIRQRLVASLSKRYKVVRDPEGGWELQVDGRMSSWTSGGRDRMRDSRLRSIQYKASALLAEARALQRQGFKVTFP